MSESGPLAGRCVVVTRTRERAGGLVDHLHALGARVLVVPLITTVPIASPDEVLSAARSVISAPGDRWAVFTSATAVRLVMNVLEPGELDGVSIGAVGPETARALGRAGVAVRVVPHRRSAGALAEALLGSGIGGATVWLPIAEGASDALGERLRREGATVRVTCLYRSEMPPVAAERLRYALDHGVDAITLTSGSTARNLVEALEGGSLAGEVAVVCIGDQTAAAARGLGLRVDAVAGEQSAAGIASALSAHFAALP